LSFWAADFEADDVTLLVFVGAIEQMGNLLARYEQ